MSLSAVERIANSVINLAHERACDRCERDDELFINEATVQELQIMSATVSAEARRSRRPFDAEVSRIVSAEARDYLFEMIDLSDLE